MLCIFFVKPDDTGAALIRQPGIMEIVKLVVCSAFSAAAMIIPGVSGSFFMMLFGVYHTALMAVSEMNFAVLLPIGFGMLIGILFCAKILDLLLKKHKQAMYFAILGFIIGSLPNIWPMGFSLASDWLSGLFFLLLGAAVSLFCTSNFLHRLMQRLSDGAEEK